MATINFKNNDTNETYDLMNRQPLAPYATVENSVKFFIKLVTTQDGQQKIQLNDMFIHVEVENDTRFLYFSDKDRVLRKINILDGREIWSYPINTDIKSICIDSNYNCYVTTNSDIRKISDSGKYVSTLNIQSDKTISDGENFYIAKGTKLTKVTTNGQEQFSYNLDGSIKDIATDKLGNIYVATDKDVRKLAKKVIGNKDSGNLVINGNFENENVNITKYGETNGVEIRNPKNLGEQPAYQGEHTLFIDCNKGDAYAFVGDEIDVKPNATYTFSYYYRTAGAVTGSSSFVYLNDEPQFPCIEQKKFDNKQWNRAIKTFTTPNKETKFQMRFGIGCNGYAWIDIDCVQLEEGTQATPWTLNKADYVNIGEWKYSINSNSIALDSENNIYIPTNSDVQKLNTQGQKIATLDIQADKIALDSEDNLYVSKDKSVEKLAKKIIGDKDSRNLIRNSGFENNNLINFGCVNDCTKSIVSNIKYQGEYSLRVYYSNVKNCASGLSISYPNAIANQFYTLSGYVNPSRDVNIRIRPLQGVWATLGDKVINFKANQWNYFTHTFTTKDTRNQTLILLGDGENLKECEGMSLYLDNIQLEEGDKATPWKPNIADYIRQGEWKHIDNSEINNIAIG